MVEFPGLLEVVQERPIGNANFGARRECFLYGTGSAMFRLSSTRSVRRVEPTQGRTRNSVDLGNNLPVQVTGQRCQVRHDFVPAGRIADRIFSLSSPGARGIGNVQQ